MRVSLLFIMFLIANFSFAQSKIIDVELDDTGILDEDIYLTVDDVPYPNLGIKDFYKSISVYCKENYPIDAKKANIQGVVYIDYVVNTDGSISDIKVKRGISEIIDTIGINAIRNYSGEWVPGRIKDENVRTQMIIPINFKL